jgi:hypothetical protein
VALVTVVVWANHNPFYRQLSDHLLIHLLQGLRTEQSPRNIGLIGDYEQPETSIT